MAFLKWRFFYTLLACLMVMPLLACNELPLSLSSQAQYEVSGVEEAELKSYLETIVQNRLQGLSLESEEEDRQRQETFIRTNLISDLQKALEAKGYYDANLNFKEEDIFKGVFEIETGALYTIKEIKITPQTYKDMALPIQKGDALDALKVLQAQRLLLENGQRDKCFLSFDVQHAVKLDKEKKEANITFTITEGEKANFGTVSFEGLEKVKEDYLKNLVPWKEGECFSKSRIESFKSTLLQSGLFSRIEENLPETPNTQGEVDIVIQARERSHRTLSAGMNYYSDEGIGLKFGWQHRNFLGRAENLKLGLNISEIEQSLSGDLTKPNFLRKDQELSLNASLSVEDNDAFRQTGLKTGASLKRRLSPFVNASTGVKLALTEIKDNSFNDTEVYGLISFPQTLNFDNRDDSFHPRKGYAVSAKIEPFVDAFGVTDPFAKAQITASTYFDLDGKPEKGKKDLDWIFAVKGSIGSILGSDVASIPATERFFSGGGNSVRGFGFQEVGPFIGGDPTGGRSVVEASAELRFKVSEDIGSVLFVDIGRVDEGMTPKFDNFSVGVGMGIRYYTDFAPIRFDIATPIQGDDNTSQNYQFYISLGQAF